MTQAAMMPAPFKVLIGKDGWLYLDNDSNGVVEQICGQKLFSPKELETWRLTLETRDAWLKRKGIRYYYLIAPENHVTYPEYLPDGIALAPVRPVLQLLDHLKQKASLVPIYPLHDLREQKKDGLVSIQTDSHWSHYGAFIAYRVLMREISKAFPGLRILDFDDIAFDRRQFAGDLGNKFTPAIMGEMMYGQVKARQAKLLSDNKVVGGGNIRVFENPDKTLPKAVFFRDSFGQATSPFMAESFSRVVEVHTPLLEHDIVEAEKPDVVLNLLCERFMIRIPNDLKDEKANELAAARTASQ